MAVRTERIVLSSSGGLHAIDVTERVSRFVADSGLHEGSVSVYSPNTGCAVSVTQFEPGLLEDMGHLYERIAPYRDAYRHNQRCRCEEGHAHIRALLTGSAVMVPFREGRLLLGERQQVVFIDFGTERTERALILQVQGE
jgi:secondary thiamine-phosphate synthase enzyme